MFDELLEDDPYIQELVNRAEKRAAVQALQRVFMGVGELGMKYPTAQGGSNTQPITTCAHLV